MMKKLNIAVIVGTVRPKRQSIHVARLVTEVGSEIDGVETVLLDPMKLKLPGDGNDEEGRDPRYTEVTKKADGFFIVVPEYNHSFPGSLKRLLDSELKNYIHKPAAFAGVSSGPFGGVRAIEHLIPVIRELGMVATFAEVYFPFVQDLFNGKGKIKDKKHIGRVKRAYDDLVWMARVLKRGREEQPLANSD